MGEAKRWFVTGCPTGKHGMVPKGQNYKEVIVPAPPSGAKKLGRHRTECPHCRAERLKEEA